MVQLLTEVDPILESKYKESLTIAVSSLWRNLYMHGGPQSEMHCLFCVFNIIGQILE